MKSKQDYCRRTELQRTNCPIITGEFRFRGPCLVYLYGSYPAFSVYQVINGKEKFHSVFDGHCASAERYFSICGDFVIRWSLKGIPPNCNVTEPVFYVSNCNPLYSQLVCLQKKDTDEASFFAWAQTFATATESSILTKLYQFDGKKQLDLDLYNVVKCC